MIIKSMPRKTVSFGQLLGYVNAAETTGRALLHNLLTETDDVKAVHKELLDNYRYLPKRKNGNVLYHEILSFSAEDRPHLTPAVLDDLARRYLDLRAPHCLAYAKAHLDTANPHIHLVISANNLGSSRRARLSQAQFARVKRELEAYQRRRYPELEHSVAQEVKEKGRGKGRGESERDRRQRRQGRSTPSKKEVLRSVILEQIIAARSGEALLVRLKILGLDLYHRGKTVSIADQATGRRYRLRTLGLEQTFWDAVSRWKVIPARMQAIQQVELETAQGAWKEMGFRGEVGNLPSLGAGGKLSKTEKDRIEEIRRAVSDRRAKGREPRRDLG